MLKELCLTSAPSGKGEELISLIQNRLNKLTQLEFKRDKVGNLIVIKNPTAEKKLTIVAALDEYALMISYITKEGLLAFSSKLPLASLYVGKQVVVGKNKIPGIIGYTPIHLQHRYDQSEEKLDESELYIHIGAKNQEEANRLVAVGEWASFLPHYEKTEAGTIFASHLDNRLGVMAALELLVHSQLDYRLQVVFSQVSKTYPWGVSGVASDWGADYNLVLSTVDASDIPATHPNEENPLDESRLGEGAVLVAMDHSHVSDAKLFSHFVKTAKSYKIPYQIRQVRWGISEAGFLQQKEAGRSVLRLGIPCRYSEAPISLAHEKDLKNTVKLIEKAFSEPFCDGS